MISGYAFSVLMIGVDGKNFRCNEKELKLNKILFRLHRDTIIHFKICLSETNNSNKFRMIPSISFVAVFSFIAT